MTTVDFYGETFTVTNEVSDFALMEFAEASETVDSASAMAGYAAMLRLVKDCIAPEDWGRFRAVARKNKADTDSLTPIVEAAFQQVTERPTGRPSDSSDGPTSTAPKSVPNSDGNASGRFAGRPDLQLAVSRTRGDIAS